MKTLALFCLIIGYTQVSFADCSSTGVNFFPKTHEIHVNSIFTIEGYAMDQALIEKLDTEYTAYLISDDDKVKLDVIQLFHSTFHLTKVLLKPTLELEMGKTYTLTVLGKDNIKVEDFSNRYNYETQTYADISWTVSKQADRKVPVWTAKPKHDKNTFTAFGCGPAVFSIFKTQVSELSSVLIWTDLKDITTGEIFTYCMPLTNNDYIQIGHGMCSGQFSFSPEHEYQARFKLMDECGNYGTSTEWHSFKNPMTHCDN